MPTTAAAPSDTSPDDDTAKAGRWPAAPAPGVELIHSPNLAAMVGRGADAKPLTGITVIVDAGHGGSDSGAAHAGVLEKRVNLEVSLRLRGALERLGAQVVMIRTDDHFVSLHARAALAAQLVLRRQKQALADAGRNTALIPPLMREMDSIIAANTGDTDRTARSGRGIMLGYGASPALRQIFDIERQHTDVLYLAVHANSTGSSGVHGMMTYYATSQSIETAERVSPDPSMPRNPAYRQYRDADRQRLARAVYTGVTTEIPSLKFGGSSPVRTGNYNFLREHNLNSVLIETGYLSNAADRAFLVQPDNQQKLAAAIANSVYRFYCAP